MPPAPAPSKPARSRPRARLRRAAKWGGLAGTILALAVFAASIFSVAAWARFTIAASGRSILALHAEAGCLEYRFHPSMGPLPGLDPSIFPPTTTEWMIARTGPRCHWGIGIEWTAAARVVRIPLWPLPVLLGIPTLMLFHHDRPSARRRRAGQCVKCGYDRAGLAPGTLCPECGGA